MHEYSLVASLIERIEGEMHARSATAVHKVRVRLGELSGVEPTLFATAYDTFREGTVCHAAPLELVRVEARWVCPRCGAQIARGEILRCKTCAVPARLEEGDDLILDRLELEVP